MADWGFAVVFGRPSGETIEISTAKNPPVDSVDSVRAFLLRGSCAPTFRSAFGCFPERRRTRTEVTEFTEGLPPLELAVRLPS
jgi:hypothetical protein